MAKNVIGGWQAVSVGKEMGSVPELLIEQIDTQKGAKFLQFKIYKPWQSRAPQDVANPWKMGYSFSERDVPEIIDRINFFLANYCGKQQKYGLLVTQSFGQTPNLPQDRPAPTQPQYQPQQIAQPIQQYQPQPQYASVQPYNPSQPMQQQMMAPAPQQYQPPQQPQQMAQPVTAQSYVSKF